MWARQPFPTGNVPTWSPSIWHKLEGGQNTRRPQPARHSTCLGPAFCQRPLCWLALAPPCPAQTPESARPPRSQLCAPAARPAPAPQVPTARALPSAPGDPNFPRGDSPASPGRLEPLERGRWPQVPHIPGAERGAKTSGRRTSAGRARPPGGCPWPTSPTGAAGRGRELQLAAALGRIQAAGRAGAGG